MEEKIIVLLEEKFKEEGFEEVFFVDSKFNETNKKLEIFLDSDSGLTISQCAKINRYLQNHIDEANWLGEKYILDVSSYGIGKPLKFDRQYRNNIGRNVELKLVDNSTRKGILLEIDDTNFVIEEMVKADPKKKKKIPQKATIEKATVKEVVVKISFKGKK